MVRARCVAHLRNLQTRFPALAAGEIIELPNRDYRYRLILPKASWVEMVRQVAEEQEWSSFKNQAAKHQGAAGTKYVRALHDVWEVMYRLQQDEDRPEKGPPK